MEFHYEGGKSVGRGPKMPVLRGEEVFDLIKVRKNEMDFTSPLQKNFAGRETARFYNFALTQLLKINKYLIDFLLTNGDK